MDDFLDAMYGTRENIGSSLDLDALEKNAEAELMAEVLKSEGWNADQINNLTGEDAMKIAHLIFGDNSSLLKTAKEEGEDSEEGPAHEKKETPLFEKKEKESDKEMEAGEEKEASEKLETKLAEADWLGRQMAHAFVDEMSQMEKAAQYEQIKQEKLAQAQQNLQAQQEPDAQALAQKIAAARQPQVQAPSVDQVELAIEIVKQAQAAGMLDPQ